MALKLLAVETSTEACSVAVWVDGRVLERYEVAPRRHTELVLPWAGELLAEAGIARTELDAIAVARGPGAFTGVRLAVALVQGMGLALDRPVVAVSTLAALAWQALPTAQGATILAAIDARMGELYLGLFRADQERQLLAIGEEWMSAPAHCAIAGAGMVGIGSGFAADGQALVAALGERLLRFDAEGLPRASSVLQLAAPGFRRGEAIAADLLEPAYLRNNVALTLVEQAELRRSKASQ